MLSNPSLDLVLGFLKNSLQSGWQVELRVRVGLAFLLRSCPWLNTRL